jgi:demethylmenaquinone methyltransferase / 2-methoxy-6-polyprenyl-1,4-benzoquinol methylase
MTGWQDARWRKRVIHIASLPPGARLLDIGTGTGDLARLAGQNYPGLKIAAADLTLAMMIVGKRKGDLPFLASDAIRLPFKDDTFEAVVSGYLIRNVGDRGEALREQFRVLKKGGTVVILDTTRPVRSIFSPLVWIHLHLIIPFLGWLIAGEKEAYRYLPESTEQFLTAEELVNLMVAAGFSDIHFERFMLGSMAIHWALK